MTAIDADLKEIRNMTDVVAVPIHGDAHLRNVLRIADDDGGHILWNDWEDVCCGPIEWDYACMIIDFRQSRRRSWRDSGLIEKLEDQSDSDILEVMILARELQLDMWDATGEVF